MSSAPAASVLVPCFRSAGLLARALDSLLAQGLEGCQAMVADVGRLRAMNERRLMARQARGS